jgi:DNA-binding NarL/FixJ family response regulator
VSDDVLRALIVDDHPLFRDGLRQLLSSAGVDVVGEAPTGSAAVAMAVESQPDVVLMDLQIPEIDGIEATRRITSRAPHIAVLVLTMFEDDDSVFAAMRAGARGYLLKGADHTDILRAVTAVSRGDAVFGPSIADRVLRFFSSRQPDPSDAFPELTRRECEVLELIADGHTNDVIARRLVVSGKTVRNHISNIFAKLRVADRAEAIVRARRAGLGSGGDPSPE